LPLEPLVPLLDATAVVVTVNICVNAEHVEVGDNVGDSVGDSVGEFALGEVVGESVHSVVPTVNPD
jgi:hypothetical protein